MICNEINVVDENRAKRVSDPAGKVQCTIALAKISFVLDFHLQVKI